MHKKTSLYLSGFFILFFASAAFAADINIPNIFDTVYKSLTDSSGILSSIQNSAQEFFMYFVTLWMVWSLVENIVFKNMDPATACTIGVLRMLVYFSAFHLVVFSGWDLINGFGEWFSKLGGAEPSVLEMLKNILAVSVKPYSVVGNYIKDGVFQMDNQSVSVLEKVFGGAVKMLFTPALLVIILLFLLALICTVVILLAGSYMVCILITAKIDLYITQVFAVMALAFFATPYTRDIAINAFKTIIAKAVKLSVIYLMSVIALNVFSQLAAFSEEAAKSDIQAIYLMMQFVVASLVLSALFSSIPKSVASMFGPSGGFGGIIGGGAAVQAGKAALLK